MPTNAITHIEIPAVDPKKGGQFYADLFGWSIQVDETLDYVMFQSEGGTGGGFVTKGQEHAIDQIVPYIDTDDLDAMLAKAVGLGAIVVREKMDIPGAGAMALFRDPSGNIMGLWQSL